MYVKRLVLILRFVSTPENLQRIGTERNGFYCFWDHLLLLIDIKSKSVSGSIPTKIIKLAKFVCAPTLTACFNHSLQSEQFPDSLKVADIIPVHKKNSKHDKDNYRPVSLLPSTSKVFEKLISNQLTIFLDSFFSKKLCGFRKQYNTQSTLLDI